MARGLTVFLVSLAGADAFSRLARSHAPIRVPPRVRAQLAADTDGGDELSKELNALVFKMPRLVDPQRASYEAFRERRLQERGEREVTSSEVVDLDNPSGETPLWQEPGEPEPTVTPIEFDIEINAFEDDEEAYVVDDIDAEDTDATDNYLSKL